ncbi:MAG: methanogenesis marker 3 protein [archaeon]|nr:methanogenesis marker 3 protein [archaeon]
MLIKINGEDVEVPAGSTIKEAIDFSNAPYTKGSIVCLIKGQDEIEKNILKYKLKTPKGSIIIELSTEDEVKPLTDFWKSNFSNFTSKNIRWESSNEVAIGPVVSEFEPSHDEFKYSYGDVIISLSGFSNEATHIIFAKEDLSSVYGVPTDCGAGVFAKVIGGRKTLFDLTNRDSILAVEPIIERSTVTDSRSVSDLDTVLEDGNQLFTYALFEPNADSPESVEHLFSLMRNGKIEVSFESNSFVGFYELKGLTKPKEDIQERTRGSVTLRHIGKGKGKIYVYREDRVRSDSHTKIATVKKGMELFDIAEKGDFITVKSNPERVMLMMMTQKEAEDKLKSLGITHIREGVIDDDAVIVTQEPALTIDILDKKEVKTKALAKEDIVQIKLYDEAPRSKWYFEKLTGLAEKPVGSLEVYFAVPDMNIFMFKGDNKESKGLVPENTPTDIIKAGEIGITNMAKKNLGYVGVRTVDNEEFGPTGEPFNSTNVVGKFVSNIESLNKLKDGDKLYIYEIYEEDE